jgi:indole-3-glycerol phosphate synthase
LSVLNKICDYKREFVEAKKSQISLAELNQKIISLNDKPRGFINSIEQKIAAGSFALISEVKKASPSKGLIRADFNPIAIAESYEKGGAACISVLTDEKYFQGEDDYLKQVRSASKLPVLRKDFMVDAYQIYESRALGADCILLIMACLSDSEAKEFEDIANYLGMDVLVEVHDEEELERALKLNSKLLGVNNRNLKTMEISLETSKRLTKLMPEDKIRVCESGIFHHKDLILMQHYGFNTFLVGESLMRQDDVESATKKLLFG